MHENAVGNETPPGVAVSTRSIFQLKYAPAPQGAREEVWSVMGVTQQFYKNEDWREVGFLLVYDLSMRDLLGGMVHIPMYYSRGFTLSCCLRQLSSGRFSIRSYGE